MRLVIRIGSGLLVAAVIAIALTVPAPAFNARYQDHGGALTISAARRRAPVSASVRLPSSSDTRHKQRRLPIHDILSGRRAKRPELA